MYLLDIEYRDEPCRNTFKQVNLEDLPEHLQPVADRPEFTRLTLTTTNTCTRITRLPLTLRTVSFDEAVFNVGRIEQ